MKPINLNNHTLLNVEEKQLLNNIYKTRLHIFSGAFFTLFMMGILYGQRFNDARYRDENGHSSYTGVNDTILSRNQMKVAGIFWLELPILSVGAFLFLKRIHPLRKDIADGNKYCIYYTVTFKQYFPLTNQYYISLDDPDYLHHEVDAAWYDRISDGDAFPVYFSRYARYAFNKNGSYTIL